MLNFRKVTKFGGDWLKNKKVTGRKTNWGWKDPRAKISRAGMVTPPPGQIC